ncbi:MAG: replicative DNA helicase [Bacillus sp. (in: Bacteria)]|nr:replicative DNA helicase [Bacillus sp. (in: firmicutes)]
MVVQGQGNIEAERLLLGCIFLDNSVLRELVVKPEHFSRIHRDLFQAMKDIEERDEEINRATLYERLGANYMAQVDLVGLVEGVPAVKGYKSYEDMLIRSWKFGKVREEASKFLADTKEVVVGERVRGFVEELKRLDTIGGSRDSFQLENKMAAMYEAAVSGEVNRGLKTGFKDYDLLTNGHVGGQFIIIAARPSVGKTAFALNIASGHMEVEPDVFGHLYSLEMTKEQFLQRMISAEGKINSQKLRDPCRRFNEEDWEAYGKAVERMKKKHLFICDRSNVMVPEIYANTSRLMSEHPGKKHFIIIDYLQLLRPITKRMNRQEEVAEISRALKAMARDLNIPIIALSQLSRGVETRRDKRPTLADLRESGSLEQDADVVSFLYREDYYIRDTVNQNRIEVIVAKQREGPVGTVELAFIKECNLFQDVGEVK